MPRGSLEEELLFVAHDKTVTPQRRAAAWRKLERLWNRELQAEGPAVPSQKALRADPSDG